MTKATKNIQVPKGFLFAAAEGGLRTHGHGPDVALIYSMVPARVAALFTTNRLQAAPIKISRDHLRRSRHAAQAILVNAGNANCATGAQGERAARQCAAKAAELFRIRPEQVLVASTGVIGVPLEARRITGLLPTLVRRMHPRAVHAVSRAILTTDTRPKVVSRTIPLAGRPITILGISKGAGMIYPRMATMLGFFFTDAALDPRFVQAAARRMCAASFNRISVDGDTSPNDTVYLMANGMAGNRAITEKGPAGKKFLQTLTEIAQQLAIAMVADGEGAHRVAEIRVEGAASEKQAEALARSIALSPLVKTALAGADPNWGRILSAAGNAGVEFDPRRADIYLNRVRVCRQGGAAKFSEAAVQRQLRGKQVLIRLVLQGGKATARFWTCDFTKEYIRINASYRT
ncbi:MAG: bifunctional glutamate N-acetyltransferase/amino-acid acetyltransferase ArgJ [Acidobacteria bacterium]|nr:bifunctional glutamate N-acetyltransferase/amino-acid acetyltransferase ArgJ [Acidobacteriota bacterium]